MSPPTPTYSLILPTCNRRDLVKRFLDSVAKQSVLPRELIVVDQSDGPETRDFIQSWRQIGVEVKYLHRAVKSLILARNAGLALCGDTDLVAFFDDDLILKPDFCEHIINVFKNDALGIYAGGMGTIDGWNFKFKPLHTLFMMPREGDGRFSSSGAPTFPHWKKSFAETEFLSGGITFWRRPIIQEFQFDPRLSGYGHGDDVDVSFRISRKHKLFIEPKASCFHDDHSPGRDKARVYRRAWIQNMFYLAQKNGLSVPAYYWCVLGHLVRDGIALDPHRFRGDLEGFWNVLRGKIDTVQGYQEFREKANWPKKEA